MLTGFIGRELTRVQYYLWSEEHRQDTYTENGSLTPFGRDLKMIQQALMWTLDPIGCAPPFESAYSMNDFPSKNRKKEDSQDCCSENHQEQS